MSTNQSAIRLGVNIDHVATVRQARRGQEPDPVAAAVMALNGGADGITVHLREDRRHIQDRDVLLLRAAGTAAQPRNGGGRGDRGDCLRRIAARGHAGAGKARGTDDRRRARRRGQ